MQKLDLDVQDSLVVLATFLDAVVTAAAQEKLRPWSSLGKPQRESGLAAGCRACDEDRRIQICLA